ncbi:unnamed protein product [Vitrella brassicaformis CCMP3155]|uniref:Uncharacterized protein n=1 Tax=Vitrella brassicaformis (strain CCMP3155) TaxID=1169540 RepID=A0A0G4FIU9_VITBC|nr:unnamed protein product [Vitrella brassicaformis CCMP3155]|eukprot:CEM13686.1 unnamed protein product [Vitrella brassicaformis CCMP3155]
MTISRAEVSGSRDAHFGSVKERDEQGGSLQWRAFFILQRNDRSTLPTPHRRIGHFGHSGDECSLTMADVWSKQAWGIPLVIVDRITFPATTATTPHQYRARVTWIWPWPLQKEINSEWTQWSTEATSEESSEEGEAVFSDRKEFIMIFACSEAFRFDVEVRSTSGETISVGSTPSMHPRQPRLLG